MSTEWDDLAKLAEQATPGPWESVAEQTIDAANGHAVGETFADADAEFIAAANPATILRLITDNRNLRHTTEADLEYQRRLEARLAAVEALAERHARVCDDYDGRLADLLAVLSAAPTDTTKETP